MTDSTRWRRGGAILLDKIKESIIRSAQKSTRESMPTADLDRISSMFLVLDIGNPRARPSRYWEELNKINLAQLRQNGYENFKRTIALNYFTWARILPWDSQILFLCKQLPLMAVFAAANSTLRNAKKSYFTIMRIPQTLACNFLSLLQWAYLLRLPLNPRLLDIREPEEGNPLIVEPKPGMKVSLDLANSILEYESFASAIPLKRPVIVELGAGYGRNAFVILKMHLDAKLIIVDIPPALWVSERYLSSIFPEKRIFRYRDFNNFDEIAEEFERSDIAFLVSSQFPLLPEGSADLILNISSLHEMRPEQIAFYFEEFDRVLRTKGCMYTKQWLSAKVLFEGLTLVESDYPVPKTWEKIFSRIPRVQTRFFEALYKKTDKGKSELR
jgi:putative sugar O-methyltransferase